MQSLLFLSLSKLLITLSNWPFEWARGALLRQAATERSALALLQRPSARRAAGLAGAIGRLQASGMAAGFDAARAQYAAGVQAGLIERSLLASSDFERRLGRLERLALGPWARSV